MKSLLLNHIKYSFVEKYLKKRFVETLDLVNTSGKKLTFFYSTFAKVLKYLPRNAFLTFINTP